VFSSVAIVCEFFVVADDGDDLGDVQMGCTDALGTVLRITWGSVCSDCSGGDTGGNAVDDEKEQASLSCTEPTQRVGGGSQLVDDEAGSAEVALTSGAH
jgi:hypothetical protein